jgi:hypothetical protein
MYRIVCVFLLVPLLVTGEVRSMPTDWAAVERLAAGERVEVQLPAGKNLKGTIDHVTADAAYIQRGSKTVEVRREQVMRLSRLKPGHGARWAIIGAVAGAGAAGAFGVRYMEHETGYGGAVAGTVGLGGLIGAGLGYVLGHGRPVLIYQASLK